MEASLQSFELKNFKKILSCIAKFGEDLNMQATHDGLQLSTVNSSKSAFCLFSLGTDFFQKYALTGVAAEGARPVQCKLLVKSVVSVLGRGSIQQSVDRLDLKIIDNSDQLRGTARRSKKKSNGKGKGREMDVDMEEGGEAQDDSREARLVIKLVCKHGVLKTHSLNLAPCNFLVAQVDPNSTTSYFIVASKTLKEWLDHFALTGSSTSTPANGQTNSSNKYESELGWLFDDTQVRVKTCEAAGAGSKKGITTELKVNVQEFEEYLLSEAPVMMTFPMREFRAAFTLADAFSVPITTAFSEASQPLSIKLSIEGVEASFVIATTKNETFMSEADAARRRSQQQPKRENSATVVAGGVGEGGTLGMKRSSQMAGLGERANIEPQKKRQTALELSASAGMSNGGNHHHQVAGPSNHGFQRGISRSQQFFPETQQSQAQQEAIRQSGLGLEEMHEEEVLGMMDMDEDELAELEGRPSASAAPGAAGPVQDQAEADAGDDAKADEQDEEDESGVMDSENKQNETPPGANKEPLFMEQSQQEEEEEEEEEDEEVHSDGGEEYPPSHEGGNNGYYGLFEEEHGPGARRS